MCFQLERKVTGKTNYPHSRLLINALLDRPIDMLMRGMRGEAKRKKRIVIHDDCISVLSPFN